MKRVTIVGLSLLAVLAFSAIAASSAFAGEFGECIKVGKGKGQYTGKACEAATKVETGGTYDWEPVQRGERIPIKDKTGVAELKASGGSVICKSSKSSGFITGPEENEETIVFSGCVQEDVITHEKEEARNGAKKGVITTFLLDSVLVDHNTPWCYFDPIKYEEALNKGASKEEAEAAATVCSEPAEGEVWLCLSGSDNMHQGPIPGANILPLFPGEPNLLVEFEYSGIGVKISGGVCGVVILAGQKPGKSVVEFTGDTIGLGPPEHPGTAEQNSLWGEDTNGAEEFIALTTTMTITNTGKIEIRPCNEGEANPECS
jgi:hypothetical protein